MNTQLLIITAFLTIGLLEAAESHWGYPNLETDEDFPKWGGLCDIGTRQSPINLSLKGALKGDFDKLEFENYSKQSKASMVNNGHSIQLSQFSNVMVLDGGPLLDEYIVEQVHLHWWSEHTVDNIRYPLETHIVHRNKRYPNMTAAANYKDGITVIGVLYHVSHEPNNAIQQILENVGEVKSYKQMNKPIRMKKEFAVRDLFPKIDGYWTYAGSLTTPSCAESVTWIVLSETFPVTLEQVQEFAEIEYEEGKQLKNNYRLIQPTHHRPVVAVLSDKDVGRDAAASLHISMYSVFLVAAVAKFLQ